MRRPKPGRRPYRSNPNRRPLHRLPLLGKSSKPLGAGKGKPGWACNNAHNSTGVVECVQTQRANSQRPELGVVYVACVAGIWGSRYPGTPAGLLLAMAEADK